MSKRFRDSESLGKSAWKKWSQNWTFLLGSALKLPRFFADFALQNMVETTLPDGWETSGWRVCRLYWHISRCFWFFPFWIIFLFLIFFGFYVFLVHPTVVSVLLSASVEKFDVSCMRDFFDRKLEQEILIFPQMKLARVASLMTHPPPANSTSDTDTHPIPNCHIFWENHEIL